ncbi:NUDIX domain-containing protein [Thermoproteota archaeon]
MTLRKPSNNPPVKGRWWFPGGRIRKGETPKEALAREVKEETGLTVTTSKLVNVYSRIFNQRHDITLAYICKCKPTKITLNNEHSEYKYTKKTTKKHPPISTRSNKRLKKRKLINNH